MEASSHRRFDRRQSVAHLRQEPVELHLDLDDLNADGSPRDPVNHAYRAVQRSAHARQDLTKGLHALADGSESGAVGSDRLPGLLTFQGLVPEQEPLDVVCPSRHQRLGVVLPAELLGLHVDACALDERPQREFAALRGILRVVELLQQLLEFVTLVVIEVVIHGPPFFRGS